MTVTASKSRSHRRYSYRRRVDVPRRVLRHSARTSKGVQSEGRLFKLDGEKGEQLSVRWEPSAKEFIKGSAFSLDKSLSRLARENTQVNSILSCVLLNVFAVCF